MEIKPNRGKNVYKYQEKDILSDRIGMVKLFLESKEHFMVHEAIEQKTMFTGVILETKGATPEMLAIEM